MAAGLSLDGVAAADLAARWAVPAVHLYARIPSAMDVAHELAGAGAPAGTVVCVEEQLAGRGRDGRPWHSPAGGLWMALILRPPLATAGAVAIRAGLAVADAVDELLGAGVTRLKWPNDVYLDGGKLGGVLGESRWVGERPLWLVLGVGLNVRNPVPPDVQPPAVALGGRRPDLRRIDVFDRVVPAVLGRCRLSGSLSAEECASFAARDILRGRLLRAPLAGRVRGVTADGALVVETAAGLEAVHEGRVTPA